MLYSPVSFEWAHLEMFGCSSAFTEFSDLGGQGKDLLLQVTAENEGL